jgi:hypothetical protein
MKKFIKGQNDKDKDSQKCDGANSRRPFTNQRDATPLSETQNTNA